MFSGLPKTIVSLRHPQCIHNVDYDGALAQGISNMNSPLTVKGKKQAQVTALYLQNTFDSFDRVFASPFLRTQSIPSVAGYDFLIDKRIGERWHGQLHERGAAFFRDYPDQKKLYEDDYYGYCAPDGESCSDVESRLNDFLNDMKSLCDCERVLISGHGISGLLLRKILTNASRDSWYDWYQNNRLRTASVTVYARVGPYYECTSYNFVPNESVFGKHLDSEA